MSASTPLTQPQMMAAINALHEAEEAKQPLSGRVNAVASALGFGPTPPPASAAELARSLARVCDHLQRRVDADPSADSTSGDIEALAEARSLMVTPVAAVVSVLPAGGAPAST